MPNTHAEASQVFRQFAWNLAGTLARRRPTGRPRPKPAVKP
jgi:hypothetical protein